MRRKKLVTLIGGVCLILVLAALPFMAACPAPENGVEPPPAEEEEPTPTPEKPIEMSFALWFPPAHSMVKATAEPWAAEVEKQTEGRLKITIFSGAALGKAPDHYDLAVTGMADITAFNPGFTPGYFPLSSVIELPLLSRGATASSYVMWELFKEFPEIQAEFDLVKMFGFYVTDPTQLYTVDKPIRTLEDMEGMIIRVPDERAADAVTLLGGTPMFMPMTELYQALERGTIDGCLVAIEACPSFRVHEVTKYCTMLDLSSLTFGVAWNLDSWNRLPQDIQKLLQEDLGPYYMMERFGPAFENTTQYGLELMREVGVEEIYLSPDEMVRWVERVMPVREAWVKDMEANGLPAGKILDEAIRLEEKYYRELN
ncbi:Solute-binding protein [subsurface metagenome]